jgi:V/A-type H+-transporting ATPase subunit F
MKKIAFITPPDAEYGFALTGITQHAVDAGEAEGKLRDVMGDPDNGLVIIDERLMKGITEEKLREMEHGWSGIFLVLPSPEKAAPEEEDYAARLIRRAIGYHVRLKY